MTTVTIKLPQSLKDFLDRQIADKGCGNASEYFGSLLREAQKEDEEARLEARLLEVMNSGADFGKRMKFWAEFRAQARDIGAER